jgi:hypothetical protein
VSKGIAAACRSSSEASGEDFIIFDLPSNYSNPVSAGENIAERWRQAMKSNLKKR